MFQQDLELPPTDRFSIVRRLGAGGMGVVYEAHDRERDTRVALKTLRMLDAAAIYRFKNEFRALAGVTHPNLVALHDLVSEGGRIFFTMELVEGEDLLSHVTGSRGEAALASTISAPIPQALGTMPTPAVPTRDVPSPAHAPSVAQSPTAKHERLRAALRQLAEGVSALHQAGRLHRDLKPSNVLVTPQGRVVILDFGLVTEIDAVRATEQNAVAGTVEYMAPEQAVGAELSEATDWYAVGVILYEALTGVLPFRGTALKVMMDKQQLDPSPPREVAPDVPTDLGELCMELLRREPELRPRAHRILKRLGAAGLPVPASQPTHSATSLQPFIGRRREMDALRAAFARVEQQQAVTVYVHGGSGFGKSALIRRVLDELELRGNTVVLSGRCYEQESVPYKAIDPLIDALSHHLKTLSREQVDGLLPRDIHALARLFPVLHRVEAVAGAPRRPEAPDPQELRRRGFGALREMFDRMAARAPLVLWLDDLQWGDVDSAALLGELLRRPDPPPMLLIASYRSEGAAESAPLAALQRVRESHGADAETNELVIGPLSDAEAQALIVQLLPTADAAVVATLTQESTGNPFLLTELVRFAQSGAALRRSTAGTRVRLDEMLDERLKLVPEHVRKLLELVAVAGRPIAREVAIAAAELSPKDERAALAVLRAAHFVRTMRLHEAEQIDTFHDRIRETVVALLDEETLKARHRRLFEALRASRNPDAEAVTAHALGAGERESAGEWAEKAAERAVEALAFERAAEWFANALEWQTRDAAHERELHRKRAEALANAGRGGEAGSEFLRAADGASATEALERKRRAAQQFLHGGHIDRGIEVLREVLGSIGLEFPRTERAALWEVVRHRVRIALFGYRYTERDRGQIPALTLQRLDTCWAAASGLILADNIRGHCFQQRFRRLAFQAGDPVRIGFALAAEIWAVSVDAEQSAKKIAALEERFRTIAERFNDAHLQGFMLLMRGNASYFRGRYEDALDLYDQALSHFRQNCTGVVWETDTAAGFAINALWFLGRTRELARRMPALIEDAVRRGDLYLQATLYFGYSNARWLLADDPRRALREVEEAMERCPTRSVHLYFALLASAQAELYVGPGSESLTRIDAEWERVESTYMLRIVTAFVQAHHLRARAALSAAVGHPDARALRARALRDARQIDRKPLPQAHAFACSIRGIVAAQEGDHTRAARQFDESATVFEAQSFALYAAANRWRQGEMLGGEAGRALIEAAATFMRSEEIRNPPRMVEMLVPGVVAPVKSLAR
jgi:serine/threonine protein kinase/tetratricopeptide (TPR) repeat protein